MKSANSVKYLSGLLCAVTFGMFLIWGSLTSSDFPRGLYGPPLLKSSGYSPSYYDSLALLNATVIWNYSGQCRDGYTLSDYLEQVGRVGLKSMLRQPLLVIPGGQELPYWVEYYSCAQRNQWQVEINYDEAILDFDDDGTNYAYFVQGEGEEEYFPPPNPFVAWKVSTTSNSADTILKGPYKTVGHAYIVGNEPKFNWPGSWKDDTTQIYLHRVRAKADLEGHPSGTVVFDLYLDYCRKSGNDWPRERVDTMTVTVGDFAGATDFKVFAWEDTVAKEDSLYGFGYKMYWPGLVNLWVDWIEYMDKDRGYPLFADEISQDTILGKILDQCDSLELIYGDIIAAWAQSDEPLRSAFTAHSVVNDTLRAHESKPTQCPLARGWAYQWYKSYVSIAKPNILDVNIYVFGPENDTTNFLGSQFELNSLADQLEEAYQSSRIALGGPISWQFTGQAHWNDDPPSRDPMRSEILAESYMALAHGAKGVTFFKYSSNPPHSFGLVDLNYEHPYGEPHYLSEKWDAVQEVFAQLDSIGDILLALDRDTAFCVYDVSAGAFQSPITNIYFAEDDTNYIEVGQFHDASENYYLILVNRRTNAGRHITVETDLTGISVLTDVYTQQQFISENRKFTRIPFAAGQGRVFRLIPLSD